MNEPCARLAQGTARLLSVVFFLAGPILALAPLGMAPLLIAAAALAVAMERAGRGEWLKPASQPAIISIVFVVWCAVTLIWALSPAEGARKLVDLALVLASLLALLAAGGRAAPGQRRILALALAGGMAVGLILLSVETGFDFPLYRALMGNANPRLADMVEAKRSVDALPLLAAARGNRCGRAAEFDLEFTVSHRQSAQASVGEGLRERAHALRYCVLEHRMGEFRDNRERSRPAESKDSRAIAVGEGD